MVILFRHITPELSTATFDGETVKVKKDKNSNEWHITIGNDVVPGKPFTSRERAIRHVNNMAEKVISSNMQVAKAKQRPLSPIPKQ